MTQGTFTQHNDYVAEFGIAEKITSLLVALAVAILSAVAWMHPNHVFVKVMILPFVAIMLAYAYRVWSLRVIFLPDELRIAFYPFATYSQSYSSISRIRAQRGNLQLVFVGGKKLNIWPGLGSSPAILDILADRTEIVPEL